MIEHILSTVISFVLNAREPINSFSWITANLLQAYTAAVLLFFVVAYYFWYDPKATTAGRFVFRFMVSLLGVMALIYIGSWLDPAPGRRWNEYPGDVLWWRPILRLVVYTYVAFSITAISAVLVMRKFWPHKLKTADKETLKVRKGQ
jgi:hypothetical protein